MTIIPIAFYFTKRGCGFSLIDVFDKTLEPLGRLFGVTLGIIDGKFGAVISIGTTIWKFGALI